MSGLKATLEPRWKKIFTKRMKKTGMSERLRIVDKTLVNEYVKAGGSKGFLANTASANSAESDEKRFLNGFTDNKKGIKKIIDGKKDWKDAENKFLKAIMKEFDEEIAFWKTKPCSKKFKDIDDQGEALEAFKQIKWIRDKFDVATALSDLKQGCNSVDGTAEALKIINKKKYDNFAIKGREFLAIMDKTGFNDILKKQAKHLKIDVAKAISILKKIPQVPSAKKEIVKCGKELLDFSQLQKMFVTKHTNVKKLEAEIELEIKKSAKEAGVGV